MAATQDLLEFVKEGLTRGMAREEIAAVLGRAGWHPAQVKDALAAFADVESPVPVPRPRPYVSAREAVTYLGLFASLYVSAYSLGSLTFDLIDLWIPDAAGRRSPAHITASIRWSVAWLIVVFPILLLLASRTARAVRLDPTRRGSKIRRQLTYATLLVASAVLIGDVTTLVYYTLGGELTSRFVLKVLAVAVIAGGAFAYLLSDIRAQDAEVAA